MASISSQYPTRTDLADQYKAQQAEKEDVKTEGETEIENLKKAYSTQTEDLKDRYESSLQTEKQKTYENLRNTKAQLNREERQLDAMKNTALSEKKSAFVREEIDTEHEGQSKLSDLRTKYASAEEFERSKLANAEQTIRTDHKKSAEYILSNSEKKVKALREEKDGYLEKQKITHAEALGQIENHYQGIRGAQEEIYEGDVQRLSNKVTADLNSRKKAGTEFIKKFDEKQGDPFYQMKRFESDLLDIGDAYVLRVKVPEYERKQFRVQVAGQEIQLAGVRTSDETVSLEPGRQVSTKSYQNVTERYKLDHPVDGRSLAMKEQGEWLEYTLPKYGPHHSVSEQYRKPSAYEEKGIGSPELEFINTLPRPKVHSNDLPET